MTLMLQICSACSAVQYPMRSVCGACLGGPLEIVTVPDTGRVLSWTRGHVSVLPAWKKKVPAAIARIALDAGPSVIALLPTDAEIGARVRLQRDPKANVLIAAPL